MNGASPSGTPSTWSGDNPLRAAESFAEQDFRNDHFNSMFSPVRSIRGHFFRRAITSGTRAIGLPAHFSRTSGSNLLLIIPILRKSSRRGESPRGARISYFENRVLLVILLSAGGRSTTPSSTATASSSNGKNQILRGYRFRLAGDRWGECLRRRGSCPRMAPCIGVKRGMSFPSPWTTRACEATSRR